MLESHSRSCLVAKFARPPLACLVQLTRSALSVFESVAGVLRCFGVPPNAKALRTKFDRAIRNLSHLFAGECALDSVQLKSVSARNWVERCCAYQSLQRILRSKAVSIA
jgi:hypothetical protein